jgi:hypothetical protein
MNAALLVGCGFALVLVVDYWTMGIWNAFFRIQATYGFHLHLPWITFLERVSGAVHGDLVAQQTFFVSFLVVLALCAVAYPLLLTRQQARLNQLLGIYAFVFWIFPFAIGHPGHSYYRGEVLLLPCVVLLRRLPWPVFVPLLLVALAQAPAIAELFFSNVLV